MNKKIILTSVIMLGIACPAFAEDFPANEYMLANKTYNNSATYANTGVYEGTVTAQAEYETVLYNITAGRYMPAGKTSFEICTAGNFCAGLTDVSYSETSDQGLTSCSTVGDGTYVLSGTGATSDTDCYKACTSANVAHSTAVTGNDYYGTDVDSCVPTACDNGYHLKSANPDLNTLIGSGTNGTSIAYKALTDSPMSESSSTEYLNKYGVTQDGEFVVDYGDKGIVHGYAQCSSRASELYGVVDKLPDSVDGYCYCKLDGYTPKGGTSQTVTSGWVMVMEIFTECQEFCTSQCAFDLDSDADYRAAMFNSIEASAAFCNANTISITWTDASAEDVAANDAGQCTYGGDIKTPRAATQKPGKRFVGWKFIKN